MAQYYTHYNVVISCPSDMEGSRSLVEKAVATVNERYGAIFNCHLQVKYWSKDVFFTHGRPQELINRGIIDDADLVIALFGEKLGTPTEKADSGTLEEIEEMIEHDKDTIVCFSDKDIIFHTGESKEQIKEWLRLQNFRENYEGLYVAFKTDEELYNGLTNQLRLFLIKKKTDVTKKEKPEEATDNVSHYKEVGDKTEKPIFSESEEYEGQTHGKGNFLKRILDAFGISEDYYDDDEYAEDTYSSYSSDDRRRGIFHASAKSNSNQAEVAMVVLNSYEEATSVLEYLHSGRSVVVDFSKMELHQSQRALDLICGGAFFADGKVRKIASSLFIITPKGVDVSFDGED